MKERKEKKRKEWKKKERKKEKPWLVKKKPTRAIGRLASFFFFFSFFLSFCLTFGRIIKIILLFSFFSLRSPSPALYSQYVHRQEKTFLNCIQNTPCDLKIKNYIFDIESKMSFSVKSVRLIGRRWVQLPGKLMSTPEIPLDKNKIKRNKTFCQIDRV